jgi:Tfp pilus assembly protein PilO
MTTHADRWQIAREQAIATGRAEVRNDAGEVVCVISIPQDELKCEQCADEIEQLATERDRLKGACEDNARVHASLEAQLRSDRDRLREALAEMFRIADPYLPRDDEDTVRIAELRRVGDGEG